MLTKEDKQELDDLRSAIGRTTVIERLVELERKDATARYERFSAVILDDAQRARDWHTARVMKPAETPRKPLWVAIAILREAAHSGIDVDALLKEFAG